MKRFLLTAVLNLTAAGAVWATSASYINNSTVIAPLVIDAVNFANNGYFVFQTTAPFEFSNVENYTNRNVMTNLGSGYRFDTAPSNLGSRRPAANFYNAPIAGNPATNASIHSQFQLLVSATNIVNRGVLSVGSGGLISLDGRNVDTSRGVFQVGSLIDRANLTPEAVFDDSWGYGTAITDPNVSVSAGRPSTPPYDFTQFIPGAPAGAPPYTQSRSSMFLQQDSITNVQKIRQVFTNRSVQIVFLRNPNTNILTRITFAENPEPNAPDASLGISHIEWRAVGTNAFGQVITNTLYLTDNFGYTSNQMLIQNFPFSSQPPQSVPIPPPTFQPTNYALTRTVPGTFNRAQTNAPFVDPPQSFWTTNTRPERVNVAYSAYGIRIATTTMDPLQVTNVRTGPGRIEMKANGKLDLNFTRIEGLNFLSLNATNHFAGASNANIMATYSDITLGSTNGMLNTSGLLNSTLPRFSGTITCFSEKWANTVIFTNTRAGDPDLTNTVNFNVLFVDSDLREFAFPQVFNLGLRSTNVLLGDTFNVFDKLTLDTDRLTVLSNGVISAKQSGLVWSDSAPHLYALTNLGNIDFISVLNDVNFVSRKADGTERPYGEFVNLGEITGPAIRVSATNMLNGGQIRSTLGPIVVQAVSNVVLQANGSLNAANAEVSISCRNLYVTNQFLTIGRSLTLAVTDSLNSGPNAWEVYDGFNLLSKPATGDLAETAIVDHGFAYSEVLHTWAGADRGPTDAGYTNNAALGMLTLDGGIDTLFSLTGTGPSSNALYVDVLVLANNATNTDVDGNLMALNLNPGMKLYFSQARLEDGTDITAALAGKNGGSLVQVSHTGPLSLKPAKRVAPLNLNLRVAVQSGPLPRSIVTWSTSLGATNYLYFLDPQQGSNWQILTNFVSTADGPVIHTDQGLRGSRFYKVRVDQ